jgi:hypothetical protein
MGSLSADRQNATKTLVSEKFSTCGTEKARTLPCKKDVVIDD